MAKFAPTIIGALSLIIGAITMVILLNAKDGPAEATASSDEQALRVEAYRALKETVPVTISGYGEARALREVPIAPEVSGRVASVSPQLVVGGVVNKGDVLFTIAPQVYRARMNDAEARVRQSENNVRALELEFENEKMRLKALARATELSKRQLQRAKQMVTEGIGSTADVEKAESELVGTQNQQDLVERAVDVYPVRIEEARGVLESANEQLTLARLDFERTEVKAPFQGRIKSVDLEANQVVAAGLTILVLADDSQLEISVPLDSRDARRSLQFDESPSTSERNWFTSLKPVECTVHWTEDLNEAPWRGTLDRVETFDPQTRTLTVAVRIDHETPNQANTLPLVEGMFCRVDIPCKPMSDAVRVPLAALTFDDAVYTLVDGRLKTTPVTVARRDDRFAYVTEGIEVGDTVIATRLVNPLENMRCDPNLVDLPPVLNTRAN